jgi:hypothetical protein
MLTAWNPPECQVLKAMCGVSVGLDGRHLRSDRADRPQGRLPVQPLAVLVRKCEAEFQMRLHGLASPGRARCQKRCSARE